MAPIIKNTIIHAISLNLLMPRVLTRLWLKYQAGLRRVMTVFCAMDANIKFLIDIF